MRRLPILGLLALAFLPASQVRAHDGPHPAAPADAAPRVERAAPTIPDVPVLTQDGARAHFYSDLVQGKTVAINFVYTTCTTVCPVLGASFASLQEALGERAGREVFLLSVSVDPATDTPERLKAWGARHGAGPGWTLVTGARPDVVRLLRALGVSTGRKEDHPPLVVLGDDLRGVWRRAYGLAPLAELLDALKTAAPSAARR